MTDLIRNYLARQLKSNLVDYAMSERMTKNLVSPSLIQAVAEKHHPRGLIHRSDRD
jgi:hypothetical protein